MGKKGNRYHSVKVSGRFWLFVIFLSIIIGVSLLITYHVYSKREIDVVEKEEQGGNISLVYNDNTNVLSLFDYTPTSDSVGIKSGSDKYFDFFVAVDLDKASEINYEISIKKDSSSTISDDNVHIYLEKKNGNSYVSVFSPASFSPLNFSTEIGSSKDSMVLYSTSKNVSGKDYYRLRMWLTDSSVVSAGTYSIEVYVNAVAE